MNAIPPTETRSVLKDEWVHFVACAYPVYLLASMYSTWLMAYLILGRAPMPSFHDPFQIHWSVSLMCAFNYLVMLMMPLGMVACAMSIVAGIKRQPSLSRRMNMAVALVAVTFWIGAKIVIDRDPGRVIDWLMD